MRGAREATHEVPTVAIIPWGDLFHDFLDRIDVSHDELRLRFTGSWLFGYASALRAAGVSAVIVCPTTSVRRPESTVHAPTGAQLVLLPVGRTFAFLRRHALRTRLEGRRDPVSVGRALAAHLGPYLGTPPVALARVLRRHACDAVLCQEYETPRFDVVVAVGRALGIPAFATFQGGDYQMSKLERLLRPTSLRRCAGLVVGPTAEIERVRARYGVPEAKIRQTFNPVDVSFWRAGDRSEARRALGIPEAATVVAWHGQVQLWRKGLDLLLAAWADVSSARPGRELRLVLAGAGEDVGRVRALVEDAGISDVVILDGWRDREGVRTVLSAADIYAFPSRHEGFPVAPIEALSCGLPVVATDAQGVEDLVGECGRVVPRDDTTAFASALGDLMDDETRRTSLAGAARERAEARFSHEAVGLELRRFLLGEMLSSPAADR